MPSPGFWQPLNQRPLWRSRARQLSLSSLFDFVCGQNKLPYTLGMPWQGRELCVMRGVVWMVFDK